MPAKKQKRDNYNHSLTFYAKDTAGNTGATDNQFMIIKLEPFIILAFVLTGAAVVTALLVYRRRRKIWLL
jgi:hypothetical protein